MEILGISRAGAVRVVLATASLLGLAVIVGAHLVPDVSSPTIIAYAGIGAVVATIVLVAWTVVSLTSRQFFVRIGGTDAQWFWFAGEPRGLVGLRARACDEATNEDGSGAQLRSTPRSDVA